MNNSVSESYAAAGVDVTAGYKAVELMKAHVARTSVPGVLSAPVPEVQRAKHRMQLSYTGRMLLLVGVAIVALTAP